MATSPHPGRCPPCRPAPWRSLRRWLYLVHRWAGIAGCLLIAMWFVSGLVMMYVAFPALTPAERLAGLPALDLGAVRTTPAAALAAAGLDTFPRSLRLEMMGTRPVYRMIDWQGRPHTVAATDGQPVAAVEAAAAEEIARRFAGHPAAWRERLQRDQWTVPNGLDPWRPLHRVAIDDGRGSELYLSARTGEVLRDTTRMERALNWLGAVPHWLYFTPLRADPPLWRQVVLWTAGPCVLVALTGTWIGWLRLRLRRRYARGSAAGISPYRGWMAWHHVAGLLGSLFLLAWLASGWLSVNPNQWFSARAFDTAALQRYAGHQAADFPLPRPARLQDLAAAMPGLKELRLAWIDGQALLLGTDAAGTERAWSAPAAAPWQWSDAALARTAAALMPQAAIARVWRQHEDDTYWYSHHQPRRLPVLRVEFADSQHTWAYLDPATGQVLGRSDDSRRAYRWLFHATHSWDLGLLREHRPAWDAWMWLLSLAGLTVSASGIVIGWRRLRRRPR